MKSWVQLSVRLQVITTWMGGCLWTGKRFQYITNTEISTAFHLSGLDISSIGLYGRARLPVSGGR